MSAGLTAQLARRPRAPATSPGSAALQCTHPEPANDLASYVRSNPSSETTSLNVVAGGGCMFARSRWLTSLLLVFHAASLLLGSPWRGQLAPCPGGAGCNQGWGWAVPMLLLNQPHRVLAGGSCSCAQAQINTAFGVRKVFSPLVRLVWIVGFCLPPYQGHGLYPGPPEHLLTAFHKAGCWQR